ncbi:MAG: hypothetical protein KGJ80_10515, partial [Chloroflexota bacterium]|nr:hypothetical protein [Chloroflexota bacterium]
MDLRSSFAIGEIVEINYWMRTVSVVSPPGGYASLSDVKVIDSINLGTKGEPIVTSGQKVLILRPSRQDRFLAIEIDPQIEKPITKLSDLIKCAHTLATI